MMQVGMLWFDDAPRRSLDEKLERGVRYYREKYGHAPTICYVHPNSLSQVTDSSLQGDGVIDRIRIASAPSILPHHFYFGISQEATVPQ